MAMINTILLDMQYMFTMFLGPWLVIYTAVLVGAGAIESIFYIVYGSRQNIRIRGKSED